VPPLPAVFGCAGLVCVVIGTFLPWLYSGSRSRNSYATDGAVRRLLGVEGLGSAALAVWPFVSLACAAAVAALVVGLARTAALVGALASFGAAAGAIAMLAANGSGTIQPANVGPTVTLVGSIAALASISIQLLPSTRFNRRSG
jgi:hypothetical protein